jgi:hypothetical protein
MSHRLVRWLPLGALLAACHNPPPAAVPLSGDAAGINRLAGEWTGSYVNPDAGRGGSIVFTLIAGEDHAHGDVVMVPVGTSQPLRPANGASPNAGNQTPMPEVLTIDFVRIRGDSVSGTLAPYLDPSCDCSASARFRGRLDGDTIRGTFITRAQGRTARGTWEVRRRT